MAKPYRPKVTIGMVTGPSKITEQDAKTLAWQLYLKHERSSPTATCTLREFYEKKFRVERLPALRKGSQKDYETRWRNWVEPILGGKQLHRIGRSDVQELLYKVIQSGRSLQTAKHVQKLVQALFTCAEEIGWYDGRNPASKLRLPEHDTEYEPPTLSKGQLQQVLRDLRPPLQQMVLLAATTSLTCAEMRGLRWRRVNLSDESTPCGRHVLPPRSLLVVENYYLGEYTTVKAKKRRRIVPLLKEIVESLAMLRESSSFSDPEDPVFASCSGKPTDTHNATNRVFRQLSKQLGFKVGWHGLRNTHATLLNYDDQLSVFDRTAQMGHASSQMTDHYTKKDLERRRGAIERVMEGLLPSEPTGVM